MSLSRNPVRAGETNGYTVLRPNSDPVTLDLYPQPAAFFAHPLHFVLDVSLLAVSLFYLAIGLMVDTASE